MDDRVQFLRWVLGSTEGYIALATLSPDTGDFVEQIFSYPSDLGGVERFIRESAITHNLYFCPTLLSAPKRIKKNISRSKVVWSDLDECDPVLLRVKPTVVVETSPKRWQGFWKLKDLAHADEVEVINKRIAYAHAAEGADKSGWDLTQLLRIPFTTNHKYVPELHRIIIRTFEKDNLYTLEDFDVYPTMKEERVETLRLPFPTTLPDITGDELMLAVRATIHPRAQTLYADLPTTDWSKALWQLMLMLFDLGVSPEEVFIIARDAACNKYARDNNNEQLLWKDVIRAQDYANNAMAALSAETEEHNWFIADRNLLTDEERAYAESCRTIIDDYMDWAISVGDASPAYHVASCFMLLSAFISSSVRLPTSHTLVVPNLWFMILADTTLTRKTTAMNMAMKILVEVDSSILAATDGSVEGLLRSVSQRPRKPSLFLRDEFSGLLESMKKKDYMAGMLETFTKLYDGNYQKKELSKTTVELHDPILLMFVGGIKSRIFELLTYEHVNSGFMPRFCIITAESDPSRMRPLGPPTKGTREAEEALTEHFRTIYNFYNRELGPDDLMAPTWEVELTPDAWRRYNEFEATMTDIGMESASKELMTPMMVRLCTSGLKAAVLLAATRLERKIVLTEQDLIRAFSYVETWKSHAINTVANSGKTAKEKVLERVYQTILESGDDGILRSKLMQIYRLDAKESNNIFDTLSQRGLIRVEKGHGTKYYPTRQTKIRKRITS